MPFATGRFPPTVSGRKVVNEPGGDGEEDEGQENIARRESRGARW